MVDPFAAAESVGDSDSPHSWERMEASIDLSLLVCVPPAPFLAHSEGPFPVDRPPQDVLDRSITAATTIYREAFKKAFSMATDTPVIYQRSYVPPSAYMKGGPISAPWEIIEFLQDTLLSLDMAQALIQDLISSAVWEARHNLSSLFQQHAVPPEARPYEYQGSVPIRSVCEDHARRTYQELNVGLASIHPASRASPDYPATGDLFTVIVPYQGGSIIYVVSSTLLLFSLLPTHPNGSDALDRKSWYEHFPEDERPPYR